MTKTTDKTSPSKIQVPSQLELLHTAYTAYVNYVDNTKGVEDVDHLMGPIQEMDKIIANEPPKSARDFALKLSIDADSVACGASPIVAGLLVDVQRELMT